MSSTNRHDLLKARFLTIRRDLDEVVDRIPPDALAWAPAEGMRTLGGQLFEIVSAEIQLLTLLREDRWVEDEAVADRIGDLDDLNAFRKVLVDVRGETLAYLDRLTPEELTEEVEYGGGWLGSLGLPTVPRAEVFLNVAEHEWYHVAQITSYLWARGVDPYA